jgi:hypothetical protein
MAFSEHDDVVEQLSAQCPDESLGVPILPTVTGARFVAVQGPSDLPACRTLHRRSNRGLESGESHGRPARWPPPFAALSRMRAGVP